MKNNYLELGTQPLADRYDYYVSDPLSVGAILQKELEIKQRLATWTAQHANVGRLRVYVSGGAPGAVGTLSVGVSAALREFAVGHVVRPSTIASVEPLLLNRSVDETSRIVADLRSNPAALSTFLNGTFGGAASSRFSYLDDSLRRERAAQPAIGPDLGDADVVLGNSLLATRRRVLRGRGDGARRACGLGPVDQGGAPAIRRHLGQPVVVRSRGAPAQPEAGR